LAIEFTFMSGGIVYFIGRTESFLQTIGLLESLLRQGGLSFDGGDDIKMLMFRQTPKRILVPNQWGCYANNVASAFLPAGRYCRRFL
jgi:hypothetical protein